MKCEECGYDCGSAVCKNCGLIIDDRPIARDGNSYPIKKMDTKTTSESETWSWNHPLSPKIRKMSRAFNPKYQRKYEDYVYIKAYESICKLCASLRLPKIVKLEALNLFRGIRNIDPDFFKRIKLAPTYLACIKIACKINDFPIMNHQLAKVIDYKLSKDTANVSYMERKFNRAYREILRLYKLRIKTPEHPNFINYACNVLGTPAIFVKQIHIIYTRIKKCFQPHFKIEGYILALIYIYGKDEYKITLKKLEEKFHTSSLTISNRKNELMKIIE